MSEYESSTYTIPMRRVRDCIALARHQDWDVNAALRGAGISAQLVDEGRSRVSEDQAARFIREMWNSTNDELMGLGRTPVPRGTFRLFASALVATAHDLESLLQQSIEFNRALNGTPNAWFERGETETRVAFDAHAVENPVPLAIDALLAVAHRLAEWTIGQRIQLRRVEVPYSRLDDLYDYDRLFGAPIVFDAKAAALVFDNTLLASPTIRSAAEVDTFVRRAPADLLTRRDYGTSLTHLVRRILITSMGRDAPSAEDIAQRLSVSPQTLRRKLREEDTTLREIRDAVLRDAAIESLTHGKETIAALSERLGFSEPSTFIRAFRRWTGSAPRSYQIPTDQ